MAAWSSAFHQTGCPLPEALSGDSGPDFQAHLSAFSRSHAGLRIIGQRAAASRQLFQLRNKIADNTGNLVLIFIAPYLPTNFRAFCREHEVDYFDHFSLKQPWSTM